MGTSPDDFNQLTIPVENVMVYMDDATLKTFCRMRTDYSDEFFRQRIISRYGEIIANRKPEHLTYQQYYWTDQLKRLGIIYEYPNDYEDIIRLRKHTYLE